MSDKENDAIFSADEWHRYTRHIQLPQLGAAGQQKLKQSHVLIVGAGGLGSPVSLYLAAAGVGYITIIDGDVVELTNLQRQILFTTQDIGHSKAAIAKKKLNDLNPSITVHAVEEDFSENNAKPLIDAADLVVDCTDNFATRYLINDLCAASKKPWLFASIFQFSGQCALFTQESACFRCLFPQAPSDGLDCNAAGVLGVLPGLLGTIQANEALKYLAGLHCPLENTLLIVEALSLEFKKIRLASNPECPVCAEYDTVELNKDYTRTCAVDIDNENILSIAEYQKANKDQYCLIDVRSASERAAFHIGGLHIPLQELSESYAVLDNKKNILCVCQSGVRSQKAVQILKEKNINSLSLSGGLAQWVKAQ